MWKIWREPRGNREPRDDFERLQDALMSSFNAIQRLDDDHSAQLKIITDQQKRIFEQLRQIHERLDRMEGIR